MKRGEIWLANLGYTGKIRPVLVISVEYTDDERAIVTYVPRTTSVWPLSRFDIPHKARGMKEGAFAAQLLGSVSNAKFMRRISQIDASSLASVENAIKIWLGL